MLVISSSCLNPMTVNDVCIIRCCYNIRYSTFVKEFNPMKFKDFNTFLFVLSKLKID